MKSLLCKFWPILAIGLVIFIFFKPFFLEGKLPIPADTIVGMYHPWRDFYGKNYPNGIPFKNFLVTDPVRQQYVWRHLAIDQIKNGQLPLWNPYNFSGMPLLANFQAAVFYPLNAVFFILPFSLAWSLLVIFQLLLAALFFYAYLKNLRLSQWASLIGAITFSFSGFSIAWLEWNTIVHTVLWLPLILLSVDKILISYKSKRIAFWFLILFLGLTASFFAGHLQIFFYVAAFSIVYLIIRWCQYGRNRKTLSVFATCFLLFTIITVIQWLPTLQLIHESARNFDLPNWQTNSWFIPWQHLIQFFAPDFFGNPATLNYWGEWNYGEFVGYIGILPLILAVFAIFFRRDKKTCFFSAVVLASLVLALPTPLSKLPYQWQLPLISTSQPTRLLFLTDFSLSILAALGFDWFIKRLNDSNQLSKFIKTILPLGMAFFTLWLVILFSQNWSGVFNLENLAVAKRNLILPTALFTVSSLLLILLLLIRKHKKSTTISKAFLRIIYIIVVSIVVFDLFRFGWKFTPFTKEEWLFPKTETIKFLENQPKPFRIMTMDKRIMPPNFSTLYKFEDIAGYDPLYLKSYGELVAAWQRGKPDISPLSFNRILTPQDYSSRIADLLNVTYVLSLKDEVSPKLKLVFQEGQTRVYKNISAYPRAYLVYDYKTASGPEEAISFLFDQNINLFKTAILEEKPTIEIRGEDESGRVDIVAHEPGRVMFKTRSQKPAILVLGDNFYSSWRALIDGKLNKIFRVDFALRGIIVPEGEHQIVFSPSL